MKTNKEDEEERVKIRDLHIGPLTLGIMSYLIDECNCGYHLPRPQYPHVFIS